MFTAFLIGLAILVGTPLCILALFFLLPIRVGVAGFYREGDYRLSGFVRGWAGLCGGIFVVNDSGFEIRVVLGSWTLWQPKDDEGDTVVPAKAVETSPEPEIQTPPDMDPSVSRVERGQIPKEVFDSNREPVEIVPEQSAPVVVEESKSKKKKDLGNADKDSGMADDADELLEEGGQDSSWWSRLQILYAQIKRYIEYIGDARLVLMRFAKRLLRVVGFRKADLALELGVGDPALMGQVFGYCEAFRRVVSSRFRVTLVPDFVQQRFVGSGSFEISIYLYRLILAVLLLVGKGALLGAKVWWLERKAKQTLAEA